MECVIYITGGGAQHRRLLPPPDSIEANRAECRDPCPEESQRAAGGPSVGTRGADEPPATATGDRSAHSYYLAHIVAPATPAKATTPPRRVKPRADSRAASWVEDLLGSWAERTERGTIDSFN